MRCYTGLTGEIITPGNPKYKKVRQVWNRAIQRFPSVIVYCLTAQDVRNAILWARKKRMQIRIRSGGHNYEGYSVGNGVLVIDISRMKGLRIDESKGLLVAQGGVWNEDLYQFVGSRGYPFPGGTCPTVGVSGYALGGGWGYSCRRFGLGCDSLVELQLIDYKGRCIIASKDRNADLFWACRGAGGGNFGVVTSMTFRLPEKVDKVTLVEINYLHSTEEIFEQYLDVWQKWLTYADMNITLNGYMYNAAEGGRGIYTRGIFYGTPMDAMEMLLPFLSIPGAELRLQYMSFLEAIKIIEQSYPDSEKFQSPGRFVYQIYSEKELHKLVKLIRERPEGSISAELRVYGLGGQVAKVDVDATAFFYRKARYIIVIQSTWEDNEFAEENTQWVQEQFEKLKKMTIGSYVNFPYNKLPNYEEAYYGQHVDKLRRIKKKVDPYDVFRYPQGIR